MSRRKQELLPSASRLVDKVLQEPGRPLPGFERQASSALLPGSTANAPLTDTSDSAEQHADAAERAPLATGDFSRVRVHTDDAAAEAAHALDARAFTFGSHIVFAKGESSTAHDLLAHELAHVGQNLQGAPPQLARKQQADSTPPPTYVTKPVTLTRSDIELNMNASYWEQVVGAKFQPVYVIPVGDRFRKSPEERDAVLSVLAGMIPNAASLKDEKDVTVDIGARPGVAGSKALRYEFRFKKSGKDTTVEIQLEAEDEKPQGPAKQPPAGYNAKDFEDIQIEKLQGRANDKLGKLDGIDKVPADERYSVKFVIEQYFVVGKARNAEVDAIVPIAGKQKNVFYTLKFQPKSNDVTIVRIGEEGDTFPQDAAKKDKRAYSLTGIGADRMTGANAADADAFKTWAGTRYPGVKLKGTTIPELRASLTSEIKTNAGTPAWFKNNYKMDVLPPADAVTRLKTYLKTYAKEAKQKTGPALDAQTRNMKTYTADELKILESSIEATPDTLMPQIRGTAFLRQEQLIEVDAKGVETPDPKTGGLARQAGTERLVTIYDTANQDNTLLFSGGSEGVRQESALTYTHELGHIIATQASLQKPFDDYVKAKNIKAITWYAATANDEFFAESMALYENDPEWMKSNVPDLFKWFDELAKTGKTPVIK